MKKIRITRDVLADVRRVLASVRPHPGSVEPLRQVMVSLCDGRHYLQAGIYLVVRERAGQPTVLSGILTSRSHGLRAAKVKSSSMTFPGPVPQTSQVIGAAGLQQEGQGEEGMRKILVPIKMASRRLGVIAVESDQSNAFSMQDRVLLVKVAVELARFLTGRGKYVVRAARERDAAVATVPKHEPQSEKEAVGLRAAAGDVARP